MDAWGSGDQQALLSSGLRLGTRYVLRKGLHPCLLLCRPYRSGTFEGLALLASASLSVKWGHHRESHRPVRTRNGGRPCRVWRRRPGLSLLRGVSCFVPDSCDVKKDKLRAPVNAGEWLGRGRREPCLVGFQNDRAPEKGPLQPALGAGGGESPAELAAMWSTCL